MIMSESEPILDREAFETLKSMTDPAFLQELIDVYLADSPDQIEPMRAALAECSPERLRRAAHSLKSNSASFGASHLTGLAREVEMLAKADALEAAAPKLEALAAEYERIVPVLLALKDER
jgi:HPt (histidine-containing phosphotransfer) domain-containing protein